MSIEAMKQALEALEEVQRYDKTSEWFEKKVSALRQAIEQAEKQEPAFYVIPATDRFGEGYEQTFWEDPAGFPVYTRPVVHEVRCTYPQCQATNGCVGACSKGQAEKQEPVAFVSGYYGGQCVILPIYKDKLFSPGTALYTTPVHASNIRQECIDETAKDRHEWVGLTDEEIIKLWGSYFPRAMEFYQAIEAKLKEKNNE